MTSNIKSRRNLYEDHRKGAFDGASDEEEEINDRASVATARRMDMQSQEPDHIVRARAREAANRRLLEEQNLKDDYKEESEELLKDVDDIDRVDRKVAVRPLSKQVVNTAKIYVGNLPFTAVKTDLEVMFSRFGRIIGVNIRVDRLTNKPKGFAFVTFELSESAANAVVEMNGYVFQGRSLTVNAAEARGQQQSGAESSEWKTVATASKKDKDRKIAGQKDKSKGATWDHWAGPGASHPSK